MRYIKYISALLVMASTLLASCTLLASSPIHNPRPHHHHGDESSSYGGRPLWNSKFYHGVFRVPAEGGVYEFKCANDKFFISKVYDSSMPWPHKLKPVNDLTYDGPFYTITCNTDQHNWLITVDPLTTISSESDMREVWVSMWDDSDDYNFVFKFEQSCFESFEYIQ